MFGIKTVKLGWMANDESQNEPSVNNQQYDGGTLMPQHKTQGLTDKINERTQEKNQTATQFQD